MRRHSLILALTFVMSLVVSVGAAQAVVVNDANSGGTEAGVSIVPTARGGSLPAGVSAVISSGQCTDPSLPSDLWYLGQTNRLPDNALCYHGGSVMHRNETFALTWDAQRTYWAGTRGYVEQFLKDVADGSGTLSSPYAITQQYNDGGGHAGNTSVYGGGCIDFGAVGGSSCEYGNSNPPGHDFPASVCPVSGDSFVSPSTFSANFACLTDTQLQSEVSATVNQTGIIGRTQSGYTPLVTVLLPPGVSACLDNMGNLCSVNSGISIPPPPTVNTSTTGGSLSPGTYKVEVTYVTGSGESAASAAVSVTTTGTTSALTIDSPPSGTGITGWKAYVTAVDGSTFYRQGGTQSIGFGTTVTSVSGGVAPPNPTTFCSYHSQVNVGGKEVPYVVQPWSVGTQCDEPDIPAFPATATPQQLALGAGQRLVSPLSQSDIAALVNPGVTDGWFALDGSETEDNGVNANSRCTPLPNNVDSAQVGTSSQNPYFLQHEFNNAGTIEFEPNTYFGCAPDVLLNAAFVVPSSVDQGDEVQFDGSATASTLIVPNAGYSWNFGDGTTATGPSVIHAYSSAGTYTVKLTVTDRGGDVNTLSETVIVLGANGQPVTTPTTPTTTTPTTLKNHHGFKIHLLLMPQGLKTVLTRGLMARVTSNQKAAGIATVSISRAAAKRAHIKLGRGPSVVVGVGTLSGIKNGTVRLHLRMSKSTAAKLKKLGRVTLTVRLALVSANGERVAIDAAGRY